MHATKGMCMKSSEQIDKLASALVAAQEEIVGALKDSNNPFFKSKYADYLSVWNAVKGPLLKNGLCITQGPIKDVLCTRLCHISGQWIESEWLIKPVKDDPQSHMAAVTYARRGALSAITGCPVIDDDDGNAASGHHAANVPLKTLPKKDNHNIYNEVKFVLEASGYEVIDREKFISAVDKFIETSPHPSEHKNIAIFLGHCPFVKIRPATGGRMT